MTRSGLHGPAPSRPTVEQRVAGARWWEWAPADRYRDWTWLAVFGTAGAAVMALAGLPPLDLHGPLHYLGVMDPLCGGTRAARYTMLGQWRAAWRYNPLGVAAVLGAGLMVLRGSVGAVSGRWWTPAVVLAPGVRRLLTTALLLGLVALEIRQQLLAPLLLAR